MAPTVADVVVDGLLRSGVARIFVAGRPTAGLEGAAARAGLAVVDAGAAATASLLAAVTGEVGDAPGVALIAAPALTAAAGALDYAVSTRAPMLVLNTASGPSSASSLKGEVTLTPESAAHGTAHAIQLALRPPRGAVHLSLALDIADHPSVPVATRVRPGPLPAPDARALDEVAGRLGAAARPVLVIGLECRGGDVAKWLRALAETLPAPVLVTPRARGVLPDPHPLNLGAVGEGNALLARADLVATVGVDALEAVPPAWPPAASILHLGAAPSARADWVPAVEVVGDIALMIEELAPRLRGRTRADWDVAALDRLKRHLMMARQTGGPARLVAVARDATPAGTVAAADEGLGAAAAAGWQAVGPSELLIPGQGGTPAFALTAALAARLDRPDRWALAFTDAVGLAQGAEALGLIARLRVPVVTIVLGPAAGALPSPAEGLGLALVPAPSETALARALTGALAGGAPCLIDTRGGGDWSPSV